MDSFIENMEKDKIKSQFSRIESLCKKQEVGADILKGINDLEEMILGESEAGQRPLSAQLSIYPLRQPSLSLTINEAIEVLEKFGLKIIPGSMSTIIMGNVNKIWSALKKVFITVSGHGQVVMIITLSNACPKPVGKDI